MRVLVSGGAGFLGSHVCRALLDRDDEVVAIDNFITGVAENIGDLFGRSGFEFIKHDVSAYTHVTGDIDAVMHLASPASPKDFADIPIKIMKVNSLGTHRLLGLALEKNARFLLASSSEVYGDPMVHPQPESYWGNVNPNGARSMYDEAKRFAEALTFAYHRQHDVDIRVARIFNTYGPFMRPDDGRVVTNFITQALRGRPVTVQGDGNQTRSLCYVDDEVRGLIALLDGDVSGPVNIGSDREITMNELARLVVELVGSPSSIEHTPSRPDDPLQRCPDITIARSRLQWEPTVDLRDGLSRTIEYFRRHPGVNV